MICHDKKFIFIPVRRAAGISLITCLRDNSKDYDVQKFKCGVLSNGNTPISMCWNLTTKKLISTKSVNIGHWYNEISSYSDYFVFTICRNPWTKIVSAYEMSNKGFEFLGKEVDFKTFIRRLPTKQENWKWWDHTKPMTESLIDRDGKYVADFTIRFEQLQEDFNYVCKKLNLEKSFFHI